MGQASRPVAVHNFLDAHNVVDYLVGRGCVDPDEDLRAERLSGGVSSIVISVTGPRHKLVVKQALPQLLVEQEWLVDPSRAMTEAHALTIANNLMPGRCPQLVDADQEMFAITITHAPSEWGNWKSNLLAGQIDASVGMELGRFLGRWHVGTTGMADYSTFSDPTPFSALRLDPYYFAIADRHPDLATEVQDVVARLTSTLTCLVHGDFSPKNVMVGDGGLWVLDFEVTHLGDPTFDVAFLLHHLLIKSVHRPAHAQRLQELGSAFLLAYDEARSRDVKASMDLQFMLQNVGCLALARVDGKSRVDYLSDASESAVRSLARNLIVRPASTVPEAWSRISALALP